MKKGRKVIRDGVTLLLMAVFLCGCGTGQQQGNASAETAGETAAVQEIPVSAAKEETQTVSLQKAPEGELFLTVSQITFSTVGETENIYAGTAPLEEISWTSEDESVIHAEDGVLTAAGVGSTTVTASWGEQSVSCQAGCLAEDRDALLLLGRPVLSQPRRIAPETEDEVLDFYEDSVMVGDSITYGFMKYEAQNGRLGSPRCLCRGKLGIHNLLTHNLELYYHGKDTPLEDVLADAGPRKAFILLGTNDVMVTPCETVISELDQLLARVLEKSPDLQIYLQSVFPISSSDPGAEKNNERILIYNEALQEYAREKGFHYVPVAPYLEDHYGGFSSVYHQDTFHPSYEGVCAWTEALRTYGYMEKLKGEWK